MEAEVQTGRIRGKGRRKIEMKKIENSKQLAVCFSKRRKGLFRKASEISSIYGGRTAVVVFNSNGKVYTCGDVDSVFDRFVSGKDNKMEEENRERFWWEKEPEEVMSERLIEFESAIVKLKKKVDAEIEKRMNRAEKEKQKEKEPESNDGGHCSSSSSWLNDFCNEFMSCDDGFGISDELGFSPRLD